MMRLMIDDQLMRWCDLSRTLSNDVARRGFFLFLLYNPVLWIELEECRYIIKPSFATKTSWWKRWSNSRNSRGNCFEYCILSPEAFPRRKSFKDLRHTLMSTNTKRELMLGSSMRTGVIIKSRLLVHHQVRGLLFPSISHVCHVLCALSIGVVCLVVK